MNTHLRSMTQTKIETMHFSETLKGVLQVCGIHPAQLDLGLERTRLKQLLAHIRADANPKFIYRLKLREPIPRNTWGRWCDLEGVNSEQPFYHSEDVRRLTRACLWFANGGTEQGLEEIIIKEEQQDDRSDDKQNQNAA